MKLEHVAFNVSEPVKMAQWYVDHLGMRILRSEHAAPFAHFLADASGSTVIEIYHNTAAAVPDYAALSPYILHIAFVVDDVAAIRDQLLAAGATEASEITTNAAGDQLLFMRDPWGITLQFVKRATSLM